MASGQSIRFSMIDGPILSFGIRAHRCFMPEVGLRHCRLATDMNRLHSPHRLLLSRPPMGYYVARYKAGERGNDSPPCPSPIIANRWSKMGISSEDSVRTQSRSEQKDDGGMWRCGRR